MKQDVRIYLEEREREEEDAICAAQKSPEKMNPEDPHRPTSD
jgi:hypothetical protein